MTKRAEWPRGVDFECPPPYLVFYHVFLLEPYYGCSKNGINGQLKQWQGRGKRRRSWRLWILKFELHIFLMFSRLEAHIQFLILNFQAFLYLIVLTCLMFLRPEAHTTLNFISNFHVTCFPCSRALKRISWFMRSQLRGCSRTTLLLFSHWVFLGV